MPTYKAIRVRYHGPTERRGSRYIATADTTSGKPKHRFTVAYGEGARAAAEGLREKLGWIGHLCRGSYDNDDYFFFD